MAYDHEICVRCGRTRKELVEAGETEVFVMPNPKTGVKECEE